MFNPTAAVADIAGGDPCNINGTDYPVCWVQVNVGVYDYGATCTTQTMPAYTSQAIWHSAAFSVALPSPMVWTSVPQTFTYPTDTGSTGWGFFAGYGTGFPVGTCKGPFSLTCAAGAGSTVTITALSKTSVSGTYSLTGHCDDGTNQTVNGQFTASGSCSGF